jgi:hypothetical protein
MKQTSFWFRKCPKDAYPLRLVCATMSYFAPADSEPMESYVCDKCGAHYTPREVLT